MLEEGLAAGGLSKAITHVISVHELSIYKPHPSVYALAGRHLGLPPERMLFVSSNPWDAAGARSFGLPVAWVNRAGAPVERLGVTPDLVVSDLAELAAAVSGL
jgi:2-haloacid dehalogenase